MTTHEHYAHALLSVLTRGGNAQEASTSLKRILERSGKMTLAPRIAASLGRIARGHAHAKSDVLVVARPADTDAARTASNAPTAQVVVDPSIVGGWRRLSLGELRDNSYKRHLLALYRSFTS